MLLRVRPSSDRHRVERMLEQGHPTGVVRWARQGIRVALNLGVRIFGLLIAFQYWNIRFNLLGYALNKSTSSQ